MIETPTSMSEYVVLARKYRPQTLKDLVGQETLCRTLEQSIRTKSLSHALVLHGIRGVGKTTTARIIAKGLNCAKGPTIDPCGVCESCLAITKDRHLDVIEMDAASHTGVDDIREIIETAKYKPVQGTYKVYIIDEVHMLSKSAFNALLKTLEEPPPFVHFIFATTEIQKIPDTILSRCMRFDLNRMDIKTTKARLFYICEQEKITLNDDAATLLARSGDGSMRDALSLLDQAYALAHFGVIEAELVRNMLSLTSKESLHTLFHALVTGNIEDILTKTQDLSTRGADGTALVRDTLDLLYNIIVFKSSPSSSLALNAHWTEDERGFFKKIAEAISMPSLLQMWQILSSQYPRLHHAPDVFQSVQVLFLQVAYAKNLPPLKDLVRNSEVSLPIKRAKNVTTAVESSTPEVIVEKSTYDSFAGLLSVLAEHKEAILYSHMLNDVALGHYAPGRMVLHPKSSAPHQLFQSLKVFLDKNTPHNWTIENGGPPPAHIFTLQEQKEQENQQKRESALQHATVHDILETFPGSSTRTPPKFLEA